MTKMNAGKDGSNFLNCNINHTVGEVKQTNITTASMTKDMCNGTSQ